MSKKRRSGKMGMDERLALIRRIGTALDQGLSGMEECQAIAPQVLDDLVKYFGLKRQGDLAEMLGTSETYLSRIHTGNADIGPDLLRKMARLLNEPPKR
jgi:transcriptional regulator with XRE-family HTH domain